MDNTVARGRYISVGYLRHNRREATTLDVATQSYSKSTGPCHFPSPASQCQPVLFASATVSNQTGPRSKAPCIHGSVSMVQGLFDCEAGVQLGNTERCGYSNEHIVVVHGHSGQTVAKKADYAQGCL